MSSIAEATKDTFGELVARGIVLVEVWGPRCAPCIALMPTVERIAEQRTDMRIIKLNATQARRLCMELKVMGLPTFLLFREGQEFARMSESTLSAARLTAWLDEQAGAVGKEVS